MAIKVSTPAGGFSGFTVREPRTTLGIAAAAAAVVFCPLGTPSFARLIVYRGHSSIVRRRCVTTIRGQNDMYKLREIVDWISQAGSLNSRYSSFNSSS